MSLTVSNPPLWGLRGRVKAARMKAAAEAKQYWRWTRSRGTYLCTADAGGQCSPRPEADCPTWGGTQNEVANLIGEVLASYPEVTSVYISGGFDGADTFAELHGSEYEPWASTWEVVVWTRAGGFVPLEDVAV